MTNKFLTPKQREVLEWIQQYLNHHQTMPSRREIALGLGLSSPATIQQHIEALEEKGFLKRGETRESRALQYTAKSKKVLSSRAGLGDAISRTSSLHSAAIDLTASLTACEIPLLGSIAAGYPIEVYTDNKTVKVPLDLFMSTKASGVAQKDIYMLSVRGDSMIDEGILSNDLVLLRKAQAAKNGDTVAALWNGEATLKKFFRTKTGVELHPANPKYPVMKIQDEDRFEIQGILLGVIRKYV
ncbi:MAG: transcriptional repressor LexA [Bdellovibrionales bacterium]|nr:transcriptional repressor LexA [Bdellovibrionales bacterium]